MNIRNQERMTGERSSRLELIRGANRAKRASRTFRMEDYLEVIHELIRKKGYAASADISEFLVVSPPSVTKMLKRLDQTGYINYEKYRGISLTKEGIVVAENISKRHGILSEFFEFIGIEKHIANSDAEGIEHYLNQDTLKKLEEFIMIMKKQQI